MQKKMYKVLTPIQKRDNQGSWFMRIGSGFTNKDDSINLYLDVIPCGVETGKIKLQIRELDENDLRQRETGRATPYGRSALGGPGDAPSGTGTHAGAASALGASESILF